MTTPKTLKQLAQAAADLHYAIATSEDPAIAWYLSDVYVSTRRALTALIDLAYGPDLIAEILDVWVDSGESLEYCADHVARNRADAEAREHDLSQADSLEILRQAGLAS